MSGSLAVDISGPIESALSAVARFVPRFLAFLVILVIGWLIAIALRKLIDALLERVGFDRLVERGGIGRALAGSRYDASDLLAVLVYYAVLLVTLLLAFGVFGPNPISDLLSGVVAWLPRLAIAIIIVVVAATIARAIRDLISGALGSLPYGKLLGTLVSLFILGLGIIAALNQIGVATTVTTPVLITVLATIGGILVVGVGGGLVRPMQGRWERWLNRAELETTRVREHLREREATTGEPVQMSEEPEPAVEVRTGRSARQTGVAANRLQATTTRQQAAPTRQQVIPARKQPPTATAQKTTTTRQQRASTRQQATTARTQPPARKTSSAPKKSR